MTSLHLSSTLALPLPIPLSLRGVLDRWGQTVAVLRHRRRRRASGPRHLAAMHRLIARRARHRGDLVAAAHYLECSRALWDAAPADSR